LKATRLVLSGLPPGKTGTGQLVSFLSSPFAGTLGRRRLVVRSRPRLAGGIRDRVKTGRVVSVLADLLAYVRDAAGFHAACALASLSGETRLTLLHPQMLGFDRTLALLRGRRVRAELLLLDSSFFCVRSYNHLPGERAPCLRCLGGRTEEGVALGCRPYPVDAPAAWRYIRELRELVRSGAVEVVAQTDTQAELARMHFDVAERPRVVGIWTDDLEAKLGAGDRSAEGRGQRDRRWDIVFHGDDREAKGAGWFLEVAKQIPEFRFLFPYSWQHPGAPPSNCEYRAMSWDTGLREAVEDSACTAVPSLWSAPIEGALVKSLVSAPLVAVVDNETAYQSELPERVLLRLPQEPAAAARALRAALESSRQGRRHDDTRKPLLELLSALRNRFIENFVR
jgi:hypothetical protein